MGSVEYSASQIEWREVRDRLAEVLLGQAPLEVEEPWHFSGHIWVQMGNWRVKFFIDAGELDYVEEIEAVGGRYYSVVGDLPAGFQYPMDALGELPSMAKFKFTEPAVALEEIIQSKSREKFPEKATLPRVPGGDQGDQGDQNE